jgi:heme A synthase
MKTIECPRESDVLDAVASGRWPDRLATELADHISSCATCADVVAVASAIQADHDAVWREASIPSSGQVWWRAEIRARQEAIRNVSRPIVIAQAAAALIAFALVAVVGWIAWTRIRQQLPASDLTSMPAQAFTSPIGLLLAVALLALAVVAPVALYVVLSDE